MMMMAARDHLEREPSLTEMLADPIVRAVMAQDGITKDELKGLIGAVQGKLASIPGTCDGPTGGAIAYGK